MVKQEIVTLTSNRNFPLFLSLYYQKTDNLEARQQTFFSYKQYGDKLSVMHQKWQLRKILREKKTKNFKCLLMGSYKNLFENMEHYLNLLYHQKSREMLHQKSREKGRE